MSTGITWEEAKSFEYWFEGIVGEVGGTPAIEESSYFFWSLLTTFSVFFCTGVVIRVLEVFIHQQNPLIPKFSLWGNNLIWAGIMGTTWFLMNQINIGFLGARFWFLVICTWVLVLLYFVFKYLFTFYKFERLYFVKTYIDKDA